MSDERAEHIKCIARTHADHLKESWCSRPRDFDFRFTSLDHAAENGLAEGRLVACPACVEAATKALRNGQVSPPADESVQMDARLVKRIRTLLEMYSDYDPTYEPGTRPTNEAGHILAAMAKGD